MKRPDGFHSITPYLTMKDAAAAMDYYKRVFGGAETMRDTTPEGAIRHAQMRIGDSMIMLSDEKEEYKHIMKSAESVGGSPVHMFLYVEEDPDEIFHRAIAAGAKQVLPMQDQPYGRSGGVEDPFGFTWWITRHTAS